MQLKKSTSDYVYNVISVAKMVGIDSIIFEEGVVRGATQKGDHVIMIFQDRAVPDFEFGRLGIGDVSDLLNRWDFVGNDSYNTEYELSTDEEYVRNLKFTSNNKEVGFRASSPLTIKAPRRIKDSVKIDDIRDILDNNTLIEVNRGIRAMKGKTWQLNISTAQSNITVKDLDGELMKIELESNDVMDLDDEPVEISHHYHNEVVSLLMNLGRLITKISVTQMGMLMVDLGGLTTVLFVPIAQQML